MATSDTAPTAAPAGDTVDWTVAGGEYVAAAGWTASFGLVGAEAPTSVTASGDQWVCTLSASATQSLGPGTYRWLLRATRSGEVRTIASGVLTLTPSVGGESDGSTHAERMLAAIECVLEGRIPADVEAYAVAGRSLTKIPIRELRALRAAYAAEVAAERAGSGIAIRQVQWQLTG